MAAMRSHTISILVGAGILAASPGSRAGAAAGPDTPEAHIAAARAAAGNEHVELLGLCGLDAPAPVAPTSPAPPTDDMRPSRRSDWHAEPLKVFDNLYFVGQRGFSAWAVTTSAGIILVDALWDYSVQDEVVDGLEKLGLDPKTIKYVLVSHAHADHAGGARHLQKKFGAHVVMSAADWDLLEGNTEPWPKPKRDLIATDGGTLTLGDTTLTTYLTPGHTPGTVSTLIPVKDHGQSHLAAEWGGTGFNFTVTADRPQRYWFETYIKSARRFREVVTHAGADVVIANHPHLDGSSTKLLAVTRRKPAEPHPYVVGNDSVKRYLTVAEECAQAGLLRLR
jgi:metallo-beta-lactamase class B